MTDPYAVAVNGKPRCWYCGDNVPHIDSRWCSRACRRAGTYMLRESPTPQQIAAAAAAIRATWDSAEEARRRTAVWVLLQDAVDLSLGWRPCVVAISDIRAAVRRR